MKVEQIYTGCLSQGAYYIVSGQDAAVIDPLRDIKPYLAKAKQDGAAIRYIFETHFHADFVSGHQELARATGATIVYGPTAQPAYPVYVGTDGENFKLGNTQIKLIHTPGHTMESSCFLLKDERGKDYAIFTGDTLFIGDVGRPDLAQEATGLSKETLAGLLYDSLHHKLMKLNDDIILYPGHGAGSACGKNMGPETVSTIGQQKQLNYALASDLSKEDFVPMVLDGLMAPPAYFPQNARLNREGHGNMEQILEHGSQPLSVETVANLSRQENILILDTRKPDEFVNGFIPGSINIGIEGSFAPWVGTLVPDITQPIVFIAEPGREEEVITRLARVGYDNILGYLEDGFHSWRTSGRPTDIIPSVSALAFIEAYSGKSGNTIVDVRRPYEYNIGHVEGAINLPLDYINESMELFPRDRTAYVYCAGGYRSVIAASILKSRGFDKLINVRGGYDAISSIKLANP